MVNMEAVNMVNMEAVNTAAQCFTQRKFKQERSTFQKCSGEATKEGEKEGLDVSKIITDRMH